MNASAIGSHCLGAVAYARARNYPDSVVHAFCREMLGIFKEHQLVQQTALEMTSPTLEEAYKVQAGTKS